MEWAWGGYMTPARLWGRKEEGLGSFIVPEPNWETAPRKLGQDAFIWRMKIREALNDWEKKETQHESRDTSPQKVKIET